LFVPKPSGPVDWPTMAKLAVAVALSFGVTATVRFALAPLMSPDPAPQSAPADSDVALRSRIAPIVIAIGSAAIIMLAGALVIEFGILAQEDPVKGKIDTLLTGVFAAVLPVFATWVGTVIAFYFTNESFRQAALVAREAAAGPTDRLRSVPARSAMVP